MSVVIHYNLNVGNRVLCDLCGVDYTESEELGGVLFCSKAVCPKCLPDFRKSVEKYEEQKFIKAEANENETFRDFVWRIRELQKQKLI